MKNLHVVTIYKAFILLSFLTASCKENEFFDPNGRTIGGVVLFRDYLTNQLDTASNAIIEISPDKEEADAQTYELEAKNGRFEANFLKKRVDFKISISYSANQYIYSKDYLPEFVNKNPPVYMLELDTESALFADRLTGKLIYKEITTDQNKVASGAIVELKTESNISRDTADVNGEFVFENLSKEKITFTASLRKEINGLSPIWYTKTFKLEYNENQWRAESDNNQKEIDLDRINLDDEFLINPMAKIIVKDENDIRLPDAEIFLYRSRDALISDALRVASVANGTSNERGIVLFGNLDKQEHFIHGRVIAGEDTVNYKVDSTLTWDNNIEFASLKIKLSETKK